MITIKATQKGIDLLNSNPENNTTIILLKNTDNGTKIVSTESCIKEAEWLINNGLAKKVNN